MLCYLARGPWVLVSVYLVEETVKRDVYQQGRFVADCWFPHPSEVRNTMTRHSQDRD